MRSKKLTDTRRLRRSGHALNRFSMLFYTALPLLSSVPQSLFAEVNQFPDSGTPVRSSFQNNLAARIARSVRHSTGNAAYAKRMLIQAGATNLSHAAESWLNQYGNSRVTLGYSSKHKTSIDADLLLPLEDLERRISFSQFSLGYRDSRTTVNLGLGQRHFFDSAAVGYSLFFDQNFNTSHSRWGVGLEGWADNIRVAANSYIGVSDWKDSKKLDTYQERPSSGLDLRLSGYFSQYPAVDLNLRYEQFFGDEVGLFGKHTRQKDPFSIGVGVNYVPIPLVSMGLKFKQGKQSARDLAVKVRLQYALGVPLQNQLDSRQLSAKRSLRGSRMDFVDRNYSVVMDYQQSSVLRIDAPKELVGEPSETVSATVRVFSKHGLKGELRPSSETLDLTSSLVQIAPETYELTLPNAYGEHTLTILAEDVEGNTVTENIHVVVRRYVKAVITSDIKTAEADGSKAIIYTVRSMDKNGEAISEADLPIHWRVAGAGLLGNSATTTDIAGEGTNTLSSTTPGTSRVSVQVGGNEWVEAETVTFTAVNQARLDLRSSGAVRVGEEITITAVAKDKDGAPRNNVPIEFSYSGPAAEGLSDSIPINTSTTGEASVRVTPTKPGTLFVSARTSDPVTEDTLTLNVATVGGEKLEFQNPPKEALLDREAIFTVKLTDGSGKALVNEPIQWTTEPSATGVPEFYTTDANGLATISLTFPDNTTTMESAVVTARYLPALPVTKESGTEEIIATTRVNLFEVPKLKDAVEFFGAPGAVIGVDRLTHLLEGIEFTPLTESTLPSSHTWSTIPPSVFPIDANTGTITVKAVDGFTPPAGGVTIQLDSLGATTSMKVNLKEILGVNKNQLTYANVWKAKGKKMASYLDVKALLSHPDTVGQKNNPLLFGELARYELFKDLQVPITCYLQTSGIDDPHLNTAKNVYRWALSTGSNNVFMDLGDGTSRLDEVPSQRPMDTFYSLYTTMSDPQEPFPPEL